MTCEIYNKRVDFFWYFFRNKERNVAEIYRNNFLFYRVPLAPGSNIAAIATVS